MKREFNYGPLPPSHTLALHLQFFCQRNLKTHNWECKYPAYIYHVTCQERKLIIDQYLWVERTEGGKWICWSRQNKEQSLSVKGLQSLPA